MANADQFKQICQGVDTWNAWRTRDPSIRPDLSGASLIGADLFHANLCGADLSEAHLSGTDLRRANLFQANLSEADVSEANLFEANLSEANLRGTNLFQANLRGTDLSKADLSGANLFQANLREANLRGANLFQANLHATNLFQANLIRANLFQANLVDAGLVEADLRAANLRGAVLLQASLIDACLNRADLTEAQLWETQRGGWSIKDVICQRVFWDRKGEHPTEYREGEFERIFAEKPRIVLRYPGGMSPIDLIALPIVVERLQAEHPDSVLQVRSLQNDAGGASVTITVEDRAGRGPEASEQERVIIQTKLECAVEERDHLRRLLASGFSQGLLKITEFLALPRQEVHIYGPTGLTAIEGPTTMSGDTYNIPGQVGAAGPGAHAHGNIFQQTQSSLDLPKLAEELGRLRAAMKDEATGTREQDKAIGTIADAEEAAAKGNDQAVLRYLKGAGTWALGVAEKIGVPVAIEVLKNGLRGV